MAIKLKVAGQLPFAEVSQKIEGAKKLLVIGCRSYAPKELKNLRQQYIKILQNDTQDKLKAELQKLQLEGDATTDEFYIQQHMLLEQLTAIAEEQDIATLVFYKSQVTHLRDVVITVEEEGSDNIRTITVDDTRKATPIESLWSTSQECLAVLLDVYFEYPGLSDSLIKTIGDSIFQNKKQVDRVKN